MKKVCHVFISGAHSTGKTTLINYIRRQTWNRSFELKFQEEIARKLVEKFGYTQELLKDRSVLLDLNRKILWRLKELIEIEGLAESQNIKIDQPYDVTVMVWDRGLIDPLTYVAEYVSIEEEEAMEQDDYIKKLLNRFKDSNKFLHFVIKPSPQFVRDDGVRYQSGGFDSLLRFHERMVSLTLKHNIDFIEIKETDLHERALRVIETIVMKWLKKETEEFQHERSYTTKEKGAI